MPLNKLQLNIRDNIYVSLTAASLGVTLVVGAYYYHRARNSWNQIGVLKSIYLHPLKSGQSLKLDSIDCSTRGPSKDGVFDRQFVLYRTTGVAHPIVYDVRIRNTKGILLSIQKLEERMWKISVDGYGECVFKEPSTDNKEVDGVALWDVHLDGMDCGDQAANWISTFLGDEARLMMHRPGEQTKRVARPKYTKLYPSTVDDNCIPLYADVSPYMLITESSLQNLNSLLPFPLEEKVFRPNFVISGAELEPWIEDEWTTHVRIGEVEFSYNKPCTRCFSTRINPENGELYPGMEPLKTLKSFRQIDKAITRHRRVVADSPIFGMHYSLVKPGTVRCGDEVWVWRTRPIDYYDGAK